MNKSIRAADILVTGQWPSSCYIPDAARSLKTKEVLKMKWNLKKIMLRAWSLYRKGGLTFGEALHRAWLSAKAEPINAATVESAKAAAGITEEQQGSFRLCADLGEQGRRCGIQRPVLRRFSSPGDCMKKAPCLTADQSNRQRA